MTTTPTTDDLMAIVDSITEQAHELDERIEAMRRHPASFAAHRTADEATVAPVVDMQQYVARRALGHIGGER